MGIGKRWGYFAGHVICILFAVLFTAVASVNTGRIQEEELPSFYYYDYQDQVPKKPEGYTTVYDDSVSEKKNIGKKWTSDSFGDNILFLYFKKGKEQRINSAIIEIKKAFPFDSECTFFYRTKDGKLDHEHKLIVSLPKGETTVYISLPEETDYKMNGIRMDFADKFHLKKMMVSKETMKVYYHPEKSVNNFTLICFIAALFMAEIIRFYASGIMLVWEKIFQARKKLIFFLILMVFAAVNGVFFTDMMFETAGKQCSSFWMLFTAGASAVMACEIGLLFMGTYEFQGRRLVKRYYERQSNNIVLKAVLLWMLTIVILCRISLAFSDGFADMSEDLDRVHVLIPFAVIFVQVILLVFLYRKYVLFQDGNEIRYRRIYLFLFFIFGIAYLFLFLPFVSPDEPAHYLSAYRVSNLLLGQIGQLGDKRLLMRVEDFCFLQQKKEVLDPKYYMAFTEAIRLHRHQTGYLIATGPMVTNSIFSYFPAGIGMAIARILNLSGGISFYFGRMGNLLFFVICLYYMMKMIPFGDTALFTMVMFPMTLHVAGSYSYDVVTFCITAMFIIRVMRMICSDGRISDKEYFCCAVNGALMAPSKMVYVPLLLFVFLVPGKKLSRRPSAAMKRKFALILCSAAFMLAVMAAINVLGADSAIRDMVQQNASVNIVAWANEEGYTISWVMQHPLRYLVMCFRTLFVMADSYFLTLIGQKLGWLNIGVPLLPLMLSFTMFLLAVNIRDQESDTFQPDWKTKGFIAVLCACCVMLTMLVMALNWTPISKNYIVGVQGRYFLPLLVPAIWIFRTRIVAVDSSIRKYIIFFEGAANILIVVHLFINTMVLKTGG